MRLATLLLLGSLGLSAQIFTMSKEDLARYTAKNPYGRLDDGRPNVPDDVLEKVRGLSIEEIWAVLPQKGFINQFAGDWKLLHPERKLVGRVVTAQFMPMRPDVNEVIQADGNKKGYHGSQNQWVIDLLKPGDVVVVDLFGKVEDGTFVGDNLAQAVASATDPGGNGATGGMVVDGSIRDLDGIFPINMSAYFRNVHPSALRNVMLTGVNVPIRIGGATVMPGDIVFGDRGGLYFIPPQFVQEIVDKADVTHLHDEWTKGKFIASKGKYKSSDLYGYPRLPELRDEYEAFLKQKLGPERYDRYRKNMESERQGGAPGGGQNRRPASAQ